MSRYITSAHSSRPPDCSPSTRSSVKHQVLADSPSPTAARTLTLVAKSVQNLANLVEFGAKEPYMEGVNPFIKSNKHRMIMFLDELGNVPELPDTTDYSRTDLSRYLAALHEMCVAHSDELRTLSNERGVMQVSLQSPPTFQQIDTCLVSSANLLMKDNTLMHMVDKNIEQNWPQHRPLRDTTSDWPPAGCSTIHHHSLGLAIQTVLNPAKNAPVQAMGCQLFQEYAVRDTVKGLAEIQVDNIYSLPCIHQEGHLVIKETSLITTNLEYEQWVIIRGPNQPKEFLGNIPYLGPREATDLPVGWVQWTYGALCSPQKGVTHYDYSSFNVRGEPISSLTSKVASYADRGSRLPRLLSWFEKTGAKGEPFKVPIVKNVEIESENKICLGDMLLVEEADYNLLGRDLIVALGINLIVRNSQIMVSIYKLTCEDEDKINPKAIVAVALLVEEAKKITFGAPITVYTPHNVRTVLQQKAEKWLTDARLLKYEAILLHAPELELKTTQASNPAGFLFGEASSEPIHNCTDLIELQTKIREDLEDEELEEGEKWFVDGSARVIEGKRKSGYAIIDGKTGKVVKSGPLGTSWSAQACELYAVLQALKELKGKIGTIFTDSKYAFGVVHTFGKIWEERGLVNTRGKGLIHEDLIRQILKAVREPEAIAVVYVKVIKLDYNSEYVAIIWLIRKPERQLSSP
ncbi:hypothetical protein DUI87_13587 [Hirundo rustica rustica]|uniref:RNase H type-1 domain-containing protein n=1 Tax=Hirundo rustica rustica TaxID=333673 RepID=A0A3M0KFC7_HIRRU|nr:hypothetical protein DUI87_13587 [Hirundo rustica rustica]